MDSSPSLLLKGGTIVNADQTLVGDVLCRGGKIVQVGSNLTAEADCKIVDVTGKLLLPGGIDPHVHFELPFV